MSSEKYRFNAAPEMNACVSEIGEVLEKWRARADTNPEQMDAFIVVHTAVLQAYALWFTREADPVHEHNILGVRNAIFDALNEREEVN